MTDIRAPHPTAAVPPVAGPLAGRRRVPHRLPWLLAAAGILCQVAFPLTGGGTFVLTVAAVVLLAGAALAHAWTSRGPRAAATLLLVAGGTALVAEAVGVRTGLPFGSYDYTGSLGREVLDVPLLVPLAWVMTAWPALLVARRLTGGRPAWVTAAVAAWALTAWDVFLDPQMVDAGHWAWADPTPALPGVPGIPLSNFAGWLVVSFLISLALHQLVGGVRDPAGRRRGPGRGDGVALTVYLWTYLSSVMANAVFFGRPSVSVVGALVMGVVAVPLALALRRDRAR